ncbi:MAG: GyrI-like domain-containing protein [Myxococcota bacterium]
MESPNSDGEGEITAGETAGGDVLTVTHKGPYDTVGQSWMAVYKRAGELGREPGSGWEIYVDDPGDTPAEQLRTQIHLPLS